MDSSGKRIRTVKGLRYQAGLIHARRHPPARPEEPQPRPLARVLPFRRKPPPQPLLPVVVAPDDTPLDPALQARVPLGSVEELAARIHVPLMPVPSKEER